MKVTPDIIRYEFIGTKGHSRAKAQTGYLGRRRLSSRRNKKHLHCSKIEGLTSSVIKEAATFDFTFNDGTIVEIDGKLLVGRSEDRLKEKHKEVMVICR